MAPSFAQAVFTGAVSGVITAALIWTMARTFKVIVLPWYQSITYSGIDLSGTWHAVDPTMAQRIELVLHQTAKMVKGRAIFTYRPDEDGLDTPVGYEPIRAFNVTGVTQDRFVALTLQHQDFKRLGINCYLLEVVGDGREMDGVFSFYSVKNDRISHSFQRLYRDRSEADRASRNAREYLRQQQRQLFEENMSDDPN